MTFLTWSVGRVYKRIPEAIPHLSRSYLPFFRFTNTFSPSPPYFFLKMLPMRNSFLVPDHSWGSRRTLVTSSRSSQSELTPSFAGRIRMNDRLAGFDSVKIIVLTVHPFFPSIRLFTTSKTDFKLRTMYSW